MITLQLLFLTENEKPTKSGLSSPPVGDPSWTSGLAMIQQPNIKKHSETTILEDESPHKVCCEIRIKA